LPELASKREHDYFFIALRDVFPDL